MEPSYMQPKLTVEETQLPAAEVMGGGMLAFNRTPRPI
ncbi:hypothetical protein COLO4_09341 [Corchorus olitorius]|uniref:Uncharacterized protein n=1 Tax=Corchorus olitorius TaxID=93759 RepID=A0A1R3KCB3_9ROSI|nr:hypothetical protein COLO4_09341 [Corchorus olitorius]